MKVKNHGDRLLAENAPAIGGGGFAAGVAVLRALQPRLVRFAVGEFKKIQRANFIADNLRLGVGIKKNVGALLGGESAVVVAVVANPAIFFATARR